MFTLRRKKKYRQVQSGIVSANQKEIALYIGRQILQFRKQVLDFEQEYRLNLGTLRYIVGMRPVREPGRPRMVEISVGYKVDSYRSEWAGKTKRENLKTEKAKAEDGKTETENAKPETKDKKTETQN